MLGTISVSGFDTAFASKDKDKDRDNDRDYKSKHKSNDNEAEQEIEQAQVSKQESDCTNSAFLVVSAANCNNVALQLNLNAGSNAIGQQ
jgi:hypothetical protein